MCQNLDLRFLPFIAFCHVFFPAFFLLCWLSVLLSSLLFLLFLSSFVFPFFFALILYLCFSHVVSSLAYPNLFGNKRLGCWWCCCCCCSKLSNHFYYVICAFTYRMVESDIILWYIQSHVWGIIYAVGSSVATVQTPQRPFPCDGSERS
jgi:hypothetical protein